MAFLPVQGYVALRKWLGGSENSVKIISNDTNVEVRINGRKSPHIEKFMQEIPVHCSDLLSVTPRKK